MSLGGGTFITQNKILPGAYINFVSLSSGVNTFGERGIGAMAFDHDWGIDDIIVVTKADFQKNSRAIFGYEYTHEKLWFIRDFFKHAHTLLCYVANSHSSTAKVAENTLARATHKGERGNHLKTVVRVNVDDTSKFDVLTYFDTELIDSQTVKTADELIDNDYVFYKDSATLTATAGLALSGGKDGSTTGDCIQKYIDNLENYTFNAVTILYDEDDFDMLLCEWTKRMREEVGKKFQCITFNNNINHECDIYTAMNNFEVEDNQFINAWVCGAVAGCGINQSLDNILYDGECNLWNTYTQSGLETLLKKGCFVFHKVGSEYRVLKDINHLTEFTNDKGKIFQSNQTVRLCDQIATDTAEIFNSKYLGKVPNDKAGRNALWSDLVKYHNELQKLRAIEDFESDDITVDIGEDKASVLITDIITVVNTMDKLYMNVIVG